jgi:pimeloyl-ACP methyl ester carboxylesterase
MRGAERIQSNTLPTDAGPRMILIADTPTAVRRRGIGRPLLFLHGTNFTGRWLPFHEALSHGADLIAPDHIGFGATPFQEWLEGFDDLVLHYEDLRLEQGLEQLDLVGYSLGGWIAAEYATFYPERVRRLVLITPSGLRLEARPSRDMMAMNPSQHLDVLFNDSANIGQVQPDLNDPSEVVRLYGEARTVARLAWNPRYSPKLQRRLRRITSPTLIIGAERDRVIPNEMCDLYAESIAGARIERVPGTGHALLVEQPAIVARLVLEFLGGRDD